jgi:hypothetical protein
MYENVNLSFMMAPLGTLRFSQLANSLVSKDILLLLMPDIIVMTRITEYKP